MGRINERNVEMLSSYLVVVTKPVVALIRDDDTGLFRVNGGIGEVLQWDIR